MNTPDSNVPKEGSVENQEGLKLKIIYAEDHPGTQKAIGKLLALLGHTVEVVDNGQLLLEKLATGEKYDLIITDNNMPIMSGLKALREIGKLYGKVPMIVCTGGATYEDIKDIEDMKTEGLRIIYLEKPPSGEKLKNAIKEVMENK